MLYVVLELSMTAAELWGGVRVNPAAVIAVVSLGVGAGASSSSGPIPRSLRHSGQ